jgi:hypothetical protein
MSSLDRRRKAFDLGATDTTVELHATDGGQVVTLGAEEQVVEQRLGSILGGGSPGRIMR